MLEKIYLTDAVANQSGSTSEADQWDPTYAFLNSELSDRVVKRFVTMLRKSDGVCTYSLTVVKRNMDDREMEVGRSGVGIEMYWEGGRVCHFCTTLNSSLSMGLARPVYLQDCHLTLWALPCHLRVWVLRRLCSWSAVYPRSCTWPSEHPQPVPCTAPSHNAGEYVLECEWVSERDSEWYREWCSEWGESGGSCRRMTGRDKSSYVCRAIRSPYTDISDRQWLLIR